MSKNGMVTVRHLILQVSNPSKLKKLLKTALFNYKSCDPQRKGKMDSKQIVKLSWSPTKVFTRVPKT